jgi:hypothetical protein
MELMYATLITLLFAAWVRELKTQVSGARSAPGVEALAGSTCHVLVPAPPPGCKRERTQVPRVTEGADVLDPPRSVTRENGVRTWVIE